MSPVVAPDFPGIYALKPRFQNSLRPIVRVLARAGVRANQVTILTCAFSAAFGLALSHYAEFRRMFLLMPAFLLIRMALNAMDGMLAREFAQKTRFGTYLNELTDVVSDAFCYLPFAYLPGFSGTDMGVVILLAAVSELAGTVAVMTGASRRYDGPLGKSDRAVVFGAVALWIGLAGELPSLAAYLLPKVIAALILLTIVNRVRHGLQEMETEN
jgi:CDP-diacylglycerol--glycerol-3-phosphate 3-phosphatidyltransferase